MSSFVVFLRRRTTQIGYAGLLALTLLSMAGASHAAQRFSPPSPVPHPFASGSLPAVPVQAASPAIVQRAASAPIHTGSIGNVSASARVLEPVIAALRADQGQRAYQLAQGISDQATRDLGLWLIARTRADDLPVEVRTSLRDAFAAWPGSGIIASQTETAILARYRGNVPPAALFGASTAREPEAQLVQAQALAQAGQTQAARQIASRLWRTELLGDGQDSRLLSTIGNLLSQEDHSVRAHWLVYRERVTGAERLGQYLTAADRASIAARGVAIREGANGLAAVQRAHNANPQDVHVTFELARLFRRADRPREAGALLRNVSASGEALVRPDIWWRERMIVSRDLIETGHPNEAYAVVQRLPGSDAGDDAEAAFMAGWIALRFLNDAARAEPHFRQILEIGTTPITRSRGYYWLGRSLTARGDTHGARQAYVQAMAYGETFYGQAAATLANIPMRFESLPRAQVPAQAFFSYADTLYTLDRRTDARLFLYAIARDAANPAHVVAMSELAARHGDATSVVQIGKIGAVQHRSLALLGYPTGAFPRNARIPDRLPAAVAYAISRQESGFDAQARSSAGALGLMQLMPETARRVARDMGVAHSTERLTSDPAHNVSLGAFHLDELIAEYQGSYILTFIAYNAGPGRVPQWIERFGDPRSGQVDVIDWIELIPFGETRSYVHRVLENIYVYQHLTASG